MEVQNVKHVFNPEFTRKSYFYILALLSYFIRYEKKYSYYILDFLFYFCIKCMYKK